MTPKAEVDRCVCHKRTFAQLKKFSEQEGITKIEELIDRRFCGCGCGMCIPYIKRMLKTGQTVFNPTAIYQEDEPL